MIFICLTAESTAESLVYTFRAKGDIAVRQGLFQIEVRPQFVPRPFVPGLEYNLEIWHNHGGLDDSQSVAQRQD